MKLKHAVVKSLVVVSLFSGAAGPLAFAQTTGGGKAAETIPLEVRSSEKLTDVEQKAIKQYISDWTAILSDNANPAQQSTVREKLAGAASAVGNKAASPAYLTFYASTVNEALAPLLQNQDVRIRLLAAIVAARVAERVNNVNLEPTALALINDKSDAVALWGMRAARYVIPWILRNPMQDRGLIKAVIPGIQAHPNVPMIQDAYGAFDVGGNAGPEAVARAVDRTLELINLRVQQYQKSIPDDPVADSVGTTFMTRDQVWGQLDKDHKVAVVQGISDLLASMGQRAAAEDRTNLGRVYAGIQPVASALSVVAQHENAPGLREAIAPLTVARLDPKTTPADIQAEIAKVYPAIQAVPAFSAVKPPSGGEAAPATTAAPAASTQNAAAAK